MYAYFYSPWLATQIVIRQLKFRCEFNRPFHGPLRQALILFTATQRRDECTVVRWYTLSVFTLPAVPNASTLVPSTADLQA